MKLPVSANPNPNEDTSRFDAEDTMARHRRKGWLRRAWNSPITLAVLLVSAFAAINFGLEQGNRPTAVAFASDWDATLAQARASGKSVLVYFTADWCPGCRVVSGTLLADESLAEDLSKRVIAYRADIDAADTAGPELAKAWDIRAIPALVIADAEGNPIAGYSGGLEAKHFAAWVEQNAPMPGDVAADIDNDAAPEASPSASPSASASTSPSLSASTAASPAGGPLAVN